MARTLSEIQAEINRLKKEADKIRSAEIKEVVGRIRKAIAHYGLTAQELFGKASAGAGSAAKGTAKGAGKRRGTAAKKGTAGAAVKAKGPAVVRYRDESGRTWVGRGKRPQWLRDALAAGRKLEEFAVK
jgi:DNA-binding protein H-NS